MDRLEQQISDVGGVWVATLLLLCTAICFLLIPTNRRLGICIFGLSVFQTLARLTDLEPASSKSTASLPVFYCLITVSVLLSGRKRLPWNAWTTILVLCSGAILCILGASDASKAMIIKGQWLLLAISAVQLASMVQNQEQLLEVLKPICLGLGAGCLVSAFPLIIDPHTAINAGLGRFMPYSANPNQIGISFAMAAIFGASIWLRTPNSISRVLCGATGALGFCLTVLTVSRMSILVFAVAYMALLPVLIKRPFHTAIIVCVMCVGVWKSLTFADGTSFERIDQGLDRSEFWEVGFDEFCQRPIFGLLGEHNLPAIETDENSHNAYLSVLYIGGLTIGLPFCLCQLRGALAAIQVWMNRRRTVYDPVLIGVLAGCSVMHVVHGFANGIIYYPTYVWAFWNVFSIAFFTNHVRLLQAGPAISSVPHPHRRLATNPKLPIRDFRPVFARKAS